MREIDFQPTPEAGRGASFDDTNWWVVRKAGRPEQPQADEARASLCRTYWRPIYGYIRGWGHSHEDAQDLTQEFLARFLEKNYAQAAAREKGKFRTYLLTLLKHFLADEWDRAHRQKRGGEATRLSLDGGNTEFFQRHEPADVQSPDKLFDRTWAQSLLEHALEQLERECAAAGHAEMFRAVQPFVTCEDETPYPTAAAKLNLSVANLKVTVHRLRRRLRERLRAELARTARSPEEVEEELGDLMAALEGDVGRRIWL